jgi:hypothetical protein
MDLSPVKEKVLDVGDETNQEVNELFRMNLSQLIKSQEKL